MKARLAALPTTTLYALAAGVVFVFALVLWFVVVSPKRAEAVRLADEVAAADVRVEAARASQGNPRTGGVRVSDVLGLAKAMPASGDDASLVLELDRLAKASGLAISSLAPTEPAVDSAGASFVPVTVTVVGRYGKITRFLRSARQLVVLRGGKVRATGRLFVVRSVGLARSPDKGFPDLEATIALDAYVYDGPIVPPTPETPPSSGESTSTSGTSALGASR